MNFTYANDAKYFEAVANYLVQRGYEVHELCNSSNIDFVAVADGVAALVSVAVSADGFAGCCMSRGEFEEAMCDAISANLIDMGMAVRYDELSIKVLDDGKGILRHNYDALN